jgi:hypothetical protein
LLEAGDAEEHDSGTVVEVLHDGEQLLSPRRIVLALWGEREDIFREDLLCHRSVTNTRVSILL